MQLRAIAATPAAIEGGFVDCSVTAIVEYAFNPLMIVN